MTGGTDSIHLTIFTDPMMGLCYESEPILAHLRDMYRSRIEFRYVMCLLVRDVADFMLPEELAMEQESGIRRYCECLAGIYMEEESIGVLPIHMEAFVCLIQDHRSSRSLNLAFKAAFLADSGKAEAFLTALRHATVFDGLPTTHLEKILNIVRQQGIDENLFLQHYRDESADLALEQDLAFARNPGIHSLPSYLIQTHGNAMILQSFRAEDFAKAITHLLSRNP